MIRCTMYSGNHLLYDPESNILYDENYRAIPALNRTEKILDGLHVRLVLGKRCNSSCIYCLQQRNEYSNGADHATIQNTLVNLLKFANGRPILSISLWGGEPLLYFDTIKVVIDTAQSLGIETQWFLQTNGLLLSKYVVDWLIEKEVSVGLSWDGPGQWLRGRDVLEDDQILNQVKRLATFKDRFSVSPVFNTQNVSPVVYANAVRQIFQKDDITILNACPVSVTNDATVDLVMTDEQLRQYNRELYFGLLDGSLKNFSQANRLAVNFAASIGQPSRTASRCVASNKNVLAVDLFGAVTTCQNFTSSDIDDYGASVFLGNLKDLVPGGAVPLCSFDGLQARQKTMCSGCAVQNLCKSGCPHNGQRYFMYDCKSSLFYYMAIFGFALHLLTGDYALQIFEV